MPVLDRPSRALAPEASARSHRLVSMDALRCVVCHAPLDFAAGQTAVVLMHIAYGYDFAHDGACLSAAREWIFVEPGYDRPAFSTDGQRVRMLRVSPADGWAAVLPTSPEEILRGRPVTFEPLQCWALVEYRDGSRRLEGIIRSGDWLNEPGGAEFPETRGGLRATKGYVRDDGRAA